MLCKRMSSLMIALLLAASAALSACAPRQATPQTPPGGAVPGAKKPAVGGELNLRMPSDPDNFNPILTSTAYGGMVVDQVYATLFEFNEKWEPTPYVAQTWTPSADGLTWTIKIKPGIKFHDGGELTAADVVFTLKSAMDKDYTGPRSGDVEPIKDVTAPDPQTVIITLKQPYAPLLININLGILQEKLFAGAKIAELDTHPVTMKPVGAGPYKFVEYKRSQYVILERDENWFLSKERNGAPYITTMRYKIIPESSTALAALEAGEIDLDTPDPKEVARLTREKADKLTAYNWERNGFGYMVLNVTRPHLDSKLVRQALTYGLDRKSIIDAVMDGRAVIPPGPIPPISPFYDPSIKTLAYDIAKAKQLLEQDGYTMGASGFYEKGGKPLKLTFYGSSGQALIEGLSAIAKDNWKKIGVDLDVQLIDFNAMMENFMKPGNFDVGFSGFSLSLDPDQYSLFHSSQVNGFNRGRYNSADVDRLLEAGRKETDIAKRKQIYSDYQQKLVDDAPVILVYANKYTDFVNNRVKGVVNFPGVGVALVYRWWVNEE